MKNNAALCIISPCLFLIKFQFAFKNILIIIKIFENIASHKFVQRNRRNGKLNHISTKSADKNELCAITNLGDEKMKLFTINKSGKLISYKEYDFKKIKQETDLEVLLENNPEYFFEGSNVLIIGRQVTTNLNTFIDLLGIDKSGNTVVIELKRGKTPRETIAQLLE
ncbi:DUF91 domain-containing protein, partial [bacterium]|nr:DUF91 domain-containing protein [bacterium]